jgi:hypothetical protein
MRARRTEFEGLMEEDQSEKTASWMKSGWPLEEG